MTFPARIHRDEGGRFTGALPKPEARRRHAEAGIQCAFVQWARFCLADGVMLFSVPNDRPGGASASHLANLIAMGMRPGAADMVLIWRGRAHFIEMKAPTGRQTAEQVQFAADAERAGAVYGVARSQAEAVALLDGWGVPHKEVV